MLDTIEDFKNAVADGVAAAAELDECPSEPIVRTDTALNFSNLRGAESRSKPSWVEISPGVHARPSPRERVIARRRRA